MYRLLFKRLIDLLVSGIALILLSPVFIVVALLLAIQNGGSPFFIQSRPGKNEKAFNIIKFKSMNDKKDAEGKLLPDNERITTVGGFVRKTSLDEIPQLINVFLGQMSLIGPRPLLFKYIPLYSEEQRKRHTIRPGITGWAQVNGRNSISWTKKFGFDMYYVEHLSFLLDMKILYLTVLKVVKKEGVNQSDSRPMMPFNGSN